LITDFKTGIREVNDLGMPVYPILYFIPFMTFVISGRNPVGKQVMRLLGSYWAFLRKGDGMFKSKPTIFQFSQKAGPNANLAVLGIGIDLLG
jgi:hypothetical protein